MRQAENVAAMLSMMDERTKARFLYSYENEQERYARSFIAACCTVYEKSRVLGIDGMINYYDVLGESVRMLCTAK